MSLEPIMRARVSNVLMGLFRTVLITSALMMVFSGDVAAIASTSSNLDYLSRDDAVNFIRFIYNDSGRYEHEVKRPDGSVVQVKLTDDVIVASDEYKLLTGQYSASADSEKEQALVFLGFLEDRINTNITNSSYSLSYLRNGLQSYMEYKLKGMNDEPETVVSQVKNRVLGHLEELLISKLSGAVGASTGIYVTEDVLENIKLSFQAYKNITALPAKIENFVQTAKAATQAAFVPLSSELNGRYSYFASYLSCRGLGTPGNEVFDLSMDYNIFAITQNAGPATLLINCIPGKSSWIECRDTIDRWAEFTYQLNQYVAGGSSSSTGGGTPSGGGATGTSFSTELWDFTLLSDGTGCLTKYKGSSSFVTIPYVLEVNKGSESQNEEDGTTESYAITKISSGVFDGSGVTSVSIHSGIVDVGTDVLNNVRYVKARGNAALHNQNLGYCTAIFDGSPTFGNLSVGGGSGLTVSHRLTAESVVLSDNSFLQVSGDASFSSIALSSSSSLRVDAALKANTVSVADASTMRIAGPAEVGTQSGPTAWGLSYAAGTGCRISGGSSVNVAGDFNLYFLSMGDDADTLRVGGNLVMLGDSRRADAFTLPCGTVELSGDLTFSGGGGYWSTGSHRTVFFGLRHQEVSGSSSTYAHLSNVEFRNSDVTLAVRQDELTLLADASLTAPGNLAATTLNLNGHSLTINGSLTLDNSVTVTADKRLSVGGNASLPGLSGGGTVSVGGKLSWSSSEFYLSGGTTLSVGSADIGAESSSGAWGMGVIPGKGCNISGNSSMTVAGDFIVHYLSMRDEGDSLMVGGCLSVLGANDEFYREGRYPLSAGTVKLAGNLSVKYGCYQAIGSHRTIFCGTTRQEVEGLYRNFTLSNVEFRNGNVAFVPKTQCSISLAANAHLTTTDTLSITALDLCGHSLHVAGDFSTSNPVVVAANEQLRIDGNASLSSLSGRGLVTVYGNLDSSGLVLSGGVSLTVGGKAKLGTQSSYSSYGNGIYTAGAGCVMSGGSQLTVNGNLEVYYLSMVDDDDLLCVNGSLTVLGESIKAELFPLSAGTTMIAGNLSFTKHGGYWSTDAHTTVFCGAQRQEVSGLGSKEYCKLGKVKFCNGNVALLDEQKRYPITLAANTCLTSTDELAIEHLRLGGYSLSVAGNLRLGDILSIVPGTSLEVGGDAILSSLYGGGSAYIHGGLDATLKGLHLSDGTSLRVDGNAEIGSQGTYDSNVRGCWISDGSTIEVNGNLRLYYLHMSDEDDLLRVVGTLDILGSASSASSFKLTSGTVELLGDMTLSRGGYWSTDTHKTVLCGKTNQTVTGGDQQYCKLGNIVVAHEDTGSVTISSYAGTYVHDPGYKTGDRYIQFASIDGVTYTGTPVTPTVRYGSLTLVDGRDYHVVTNGGVGTGDVGTYSIEIAGIAPYKGSQTFTYKVAKGDVTKAEIAAIAARVFDGNEQRPVPVVSVDTRTLIPDTDYTVNYKNNVNVGTASVVITGIGNYSGTKTVTFEIVKSAAAMAVIDAITALDVNTLYGAKSVASVRTAYDELSDADRLVVTNATKLTEAEQSAAQLLDIASAIATSANDAEIAVAAIETASDGSDVVESSHWASEVQKNSLATTIRASLEVAQDNSSTLAQLTAAMTQLADALSTFEVSVKAQVGSAHQPGEAVRENVLPATATSSASYDEATYCTVCGNELSRTHVTVPKSPDPAVVADSATVEQGGSAIDLAANVTGAAGAVHFAIDGDEMGCNVTDAGLFTSGGIIGVCNVAVTIVETVEHAGRTERIRVSVCAPADPCAAGHDWGKPEYAWSSDLTSVTATRICNRDKGHIETEVAGVVCSEHKQPTCTVAGEDMLVARFTNLGFPTVIRYEPGVSALGHSWSAWRVVTAATYDASGREKRTCTRCGASRTREVPKLAKTDISSAQVTVSAEPHIYSARELTPEPTVIVEGKSLRLGDDFVVAYANNVNAGTATITVTGTGAYSGSAITSFAISPADISNATLSKPTTQTYSGACVEPDISVILDGVTLAAGQDYTLSYRDNDAVGMGEVIVTGKGNYYGSTEVAFNIVAKDCEHEWDDGTVVKAPACTEAGEKAYVCALCGEWRYEPLPVLGHDWGVWEVMAQPTYDAPGRDSRACDRCGTIEQREVGRLQRISISDATVSVSDATYDGKEKRPSVTVVIGEQALVLGDDYELAFANNVNPGTATVTVTGKGGYTGRVTATFEIVAPASASSDMHRLYNPNAGEHFYTADEAERDDLVRVGWRYEGVGWVAPAEGDPVFRLYNPNAGDHHYTTDEAERDFLVSVGWRYEGVGWVSAGEGGVALLRLYNPNATSGSHHYTTDEAERDFLVSVGWRYEGVGWWGLA